LPSHKGPSNANSHRRFPNVTQWITEYNYDDQDLSTTQSFFNTSADYFDRLDSVGRYSYFGSFRSKVSNVGQNAVMLSNTGKLTDIGSWYLGGSATGVSPTDSAAGRSESAVVLTIVSVLFGAATLSGFF
jgi:hypothetical protein